MYTYLYVAIVNVAVAGDNGTRITISPVNSTSTCPTMLSHRRTAICMHLNALQPRLLCYFTFYTHVPLFCFLSLSSMQFCLYESRYLYSIVLLLCISDDRITTLVKYVKHHDTVIPPTIRNLDLR